LAALEVRFDSGAGDNITVRDYLHKLLTRVWQLDEDFNGKRPFGNSGWDFDIYAPLIKAGFIAGEVDEHGDIGEFDRDIAAGYVFDLIDAAFYGVSDGCKDGD